MNERIFIDEEFANLIPPLAEDEFKQLEENCIKDGIRDALVVWNGTLIDGHNRYKIAQAHNLPYQVKKMEFADRGSAIAWIITNQIGRRNLNKYDRAVLALKLKPIIAEQQRQKQVEGGKEKVQQKSVEPTTTQKELAKIAGVSHDTIHKVDVIENSGNDYVKEQAKKGEISVNAAYNMVNTKSPSQEKKEYMEKVKQRHEDFQERKADDVVSIAEIQKDKDDQETIATEAYQMCLSSGNKLETLYNNIRENRIDLKMMANNTSSDSMNILRDSLHRWTMIINKILREIES